MASEAVRTLPGGAKAVKRTGSGCPHCCGWFGLENADTADVLDLGEGVLVDVDDDGRVVGVGYLGGPVTDSVLFWAAQRVAELAS